MRARALIGFASFAVMVVAMPLALSIAAETAVPESSTSTAISSATYISAGEVNAILRQLSPNDTDDEPVRVVSAGTYNVGLFVVGRPRRTGPTAVEKDGSMRVTEGLQLDRITVVLEIVRGEGQLVTGGTLADAKRMAPDDPDLPVIGPGNRGKLIRGGALRMVGPGDTIIIPSGVVHGFSEIKEPLVYSVIRIDAGKALPLK